MFTLPGPHNPRKRDMLCSPYQALTTPVRVTCCVHPTRPSQPLRGTFCHICASQEVEIKCTFGVFRSATFGRKGRKEMFYLMTHLTPFLNIYGYMVKDHTDSERGNLLPPHELLFLFNSKGSFICTIPQTG